PETVAVARKRTISAGQNTGARVSRKSPCTSKLDPPAGRGGGSHVRLTGGGVQPSGAAEKATFASQMSLGEKIPPDPGMSCSGGLEYHERRYRSAESGASAV